MSASDHPSREKSVLTEPAAATQDITADVISTQVPHEVAEPHGPNSFAIADGVAGEKTGIALTRVTSDDERYPTPTEDEFSTLRKVTDGVPMVIWFLCLVEFSERASYYGAKTVFTNFMLFPLPKGGECGINYRYLQGLSPFRRQETVPEPRPQVRKRPPALSGRVFSSRTRSSCCLPSCLTSSPSWARGSPTPVLVASRPSSSAFSSASSPISS